MEINTNQLIANTSTASLYLINDDNKKYVYKEFNYLHDPTELERFETFTTIKISNIAFPIEIVKQDGGIRGYVMDYVEGQTLEAFRDIINRITIISEVPLDIIIREVSRLSDSYKQLALNKIEVGDVNLTNLLYSNGNIVNIDTDSFKLHKQINPLTLIARNWLSLKQACYTLLSDNFAIPNDMKNELLRSITSKASESAGDWFKNVIRNIENKYDTKFSTLLEISEVIKENEKNNSYSGANRSR